jgi:uncharacterized OB-fold protein
MEPGNPDAREAEERPQTAPGTVTLLVPDEHNEVDDYGVIVTANGTEVWAQFGAVTDQPRALDVGTAVEVEYYPKEYDGDPRQDGYQFIAGRVTPG